MTLNASGPIILAGTTAGQSIEIELGGSGTAQISLNCTTVRTLAGVASGAIIMPTNFYGKSNGTTKGVFYGGLVTTYTNLVTRINACGALVGSETAAGTARGLFAGAKVGANGLFYNVGLVTRINACGALVGSETNVGTVRNALAGATVGSNGLFYGGGTGGGGCCCVTYYNTVTRINACGALVGSETNVGTARDYLAGATVGSNGLFYGGCFRSNTVTRINACGALVGSQTNVGTVREILAGATVGSNGLFYGGYATINNVGVISNIVTRINACGALVGSETNVGTIRYALAGATVGSNGLFYGGYAAAASNLVTRINACGALVGSQTNVGTAREYLAGAGL